MLQFSPPIHEKPVPLYPTLQLQLYEPLVFEHDALVSHLWSPVSHSTTSDYNIIYLYIMQLK